MNYAAKPWETRFSANVPLRPRRKPPGWAIALPQSRGKLCYVTTLDRFALIKGDRATAACDLLLSVDVTQSDDAVYDHKTDGPGEPDGSAAAVRAMLNLNGGPKGRWWSREGITLAPGAHTLRIPLAPAHWSGIYGQGADATPADRRAFRRHLTQPVLLCLTFGGGIDYGHGVRMAAGSATFALRNFLIVRS